MSEQLIVAVDPASDDGDTTTYYEAINHADGVVITRYLTKEQFDALYGKDTYIMEKPKRLTPSPLAILTEALKKRWEAAFTPRRFYEMPRGNGRKPPSHFVEPNCARHLRHRVTHNGTAFVYSQNRRARFS